MDDLLSLSASALARAIRGRDVSAREVVEAHIGQAGRVNPTINALVRDRFALARAEADEADRRVAHADPASLPPFHGVPCTIKESFELVGMPNTAGLVARRDARPWRDATAVARLRAAGAIPIGVTNTSELCMWLESNNRVYGRTSNAHDPTRIAGGSSGGEGAIVGAGASPLGLGADIGGSIRLPAFFNGVFGHKPTGGLIPNTGQFPTSEGQGLRYLTTGPLCRRAEDLMPLLRVLAGADGVDAGCRELALGDPARVQVAALRVLDIRGNGLSPVSHALGEAQGRAVAHLRGLGAAVSSPRFPVLARSFEIWAALLTQAEGSGKFRRLMQRGGTHDLLWQLVLWGMGRSPHTFPALALALVDEVGDLAPGLARRSIERGQQLKVELTEALGRDGVMLYPSFVSTAPAHRRPARSMLKYALASAYTSIFNVLELPSTQVPLGLDRAGLPLGVQVVGGPGNDHMTIAVAMELERAFGGWVSPRASEKGSRR